MRYFCTYCDKNYLVRCLSLFKSLKNQGLPFRLWVLCMDDATYKALSNMNLPEIRPIALDELEKADPGLLKAKENRSKLDYYLTCTPSLPLFALKDDPKVDIITYLDADLFFFSNPSPIYDEIGDASIAIIPMRFDDAHKIVAKFCGTYNVGWVSFRRDKNGLECLNWWREKCIEWCSERFEDGTFADQGYLDEFPTRFKGVKILNHKGANLAPYNVVNYSIHKNSKGVEVDEQPLIFYHFSSVKRLNRWVYDPSIVGWGIKFTPELRKLIYRPYFTALFDAYSELLSVAANDGFKAVFPISQGIRQPIVSPDAKPDNSFIAKIKRNIEPAKGLLDGRYLLATRKLVI